MDGKQRRALNFKAEELEVLINLIENSKDILFGKFTPTLTKEKKELEWVKIADSVSAVAGIPRSTEAVKKKVYDHVQWHEEESSSSL